MPTVLRVDGFTFGFYANDHEPPHVHVFKGGSECKIVLSTLDIVNWGMKPADLARAAAIVQEHADELLVAWVRFHAA
jgi:hypothetical protein